MSEREFAALTRKAITLSADEHGPKVLLTPDGRMVKLFRRKRLISSNLFRPYARRFESAARELAARGFPAVRMERMARVPAIHRDIVIYSHLPGISIRQAIAEGVDCTKPLTMLAHTLAKLHERGVYFRGAHLGNFLMWPAGHPARDLALIDISEARFRRNSLPSWLRARNFKPMARHAQDLDAVRRFGASRFLSAYLEAAAMTLAESQRFRGALAGIHMAFAGAAPIVLAT